MEMFHGISAYFGRKNRGIFGRARAIKGCLGNEICTADRPIGPIGVVVDGHITSIFDGDCYSYINEHGRRVPHEGMGRHSCQINNPSDEVVIEFVRTAHSDSYYGNRHYCEAFSIGERITMVWVKAWADTRTKKEARVLSRLFDAPLLEVEGSDRIDQLVCPEDRYSEYEYLEAIL